MENYLRFVCILLFCYGCKEDYGGSYVSYCNDAKTTGTLRVFDAETNKPLAGLTFYAVQNDLSFITFNPGLTVLDTFFSDSSGKLTWEFEHSVATGITYFLVPAQDSLYLSADQYNLPTGCATTFDAPMKKKMPATLSVINTKSEPLLNYSVFMEIMPRYDETGVLGRDTVFLGQFDLDSIPAKSTATLTVPSVPNELLRLYSGYNRGLVRLFRETNIFTSAENYLNFSITL